MQHSVSSFSSTRSSSSARSRETPFTNNKLIPELNVFSNGPGPGKYSRPNSSHDLTLVASPAYTIPKSKRSGGIYYAEKTPDYYYYPQRDKSPAYVIGRKFKSNYKFKTPSPTDYEPERSKDYIKAAIPYGTMGKAARFNKFLTIF